MSNPARHVLTTQGISSEVRSYTGDGTDLLGHVTLADFDGGVLLREVRERTKGLPGITALFESSPGKFHVWNLTVGQIDETALRLVRLGSDYKHVRVGLVTTGRWVLRIAEKRPSNAEDYAAAEGRGASAPEPLDVWVNATDQPQSEPHYKVLQSVLEEREPRMRGRLREHTDARDLSFVGSAYRQELYRTATRDWIEGEV